MRPYQGCGVGWLAIFRSRRMAVVFVLGFSSGLPLLLTSQTLQAWMTATGADLGQISALSAVGLAYTFKFSIAPLLDRYRLPFLGRRRGWMLVLQLALVVAIALMGLVDPVAQPGWLVALAIAVAVLGASQDIVIDAYKADILAPEERAAGVSLYVIGYRIALVFTGTLALVLADHLPWSAIYALLAALMVIGVCATLAAEEPVAPAHPPATLEEALYLPFVELVRRLGIRGCVLIVAFTALYKFGDYLAQAVIIPFFVRGAGFDFTEIAIVYQVLGFVGIAVGGLSAGALATRFGMRRMLIAFGLLQALTNLLYAWLALVGDNLPLFGTAVLLDNLANAMGTATFVAFLMSLCSAAVSATQLALLTSLSSIGQRVFGPFADEIVVYVGWSGFFVITSALAIPGLVLAWWAARAPAESPGASRWTS